MGKILIADDNEQNSRILKDVLESFSYGVFLATSGAEALTIAEKEIPDLILLDVMMPGLSGYEVCQILRRNPQTNHIPIVLLTALGEVEDRIHGYNVGADVFMTKPIDYQELTAVINKFLREKENVVWAEGVDKVIDFLTCLLPAGTEQAVPEKLLVAVKEEYGSQLVQALQLTPSESRYLDMVIQLQGLEKYLRDGARKEKVKRALLQLQMGKWLLPILTYEVGNNQGEAMKCLQDKEPTVKIAEIFLVIKYYAKFFLENKGNRADTITALRRLAKKGLCDEKLVETMADIFKKRSFLENLSLNTIN